MKGRRVLLLSAVTAGLVAGALLALIVAGWWRGSVSYVLRFDVPAAATVSGLYQTELLRTREPAPAPVRDTPVTDAYEARLLGRGVPFAWTRDAVQLTVEGFDRRIGWSAVVPVRVSRPPGHALPTVRVAVDGVETIVRFPQDDTDMLRVPIPPRARNGVRLDLLVDPVFVPQGDDRALGIQMVGVRFDPDGLPTPTAAAIGAAASAAILLMILIVATGLRPLTLTMSAGLLVLHAWLLTFGLGSFGEFPWRSMTWAGPVIGLAGLVCWLIGKRDDARSWQAAVAIAAVMLVAQGWILLHPSMIAGDSGFHLHRFTDVREGRYFFTSGGPGGQFPYPIALYVAALPWSGSVSDHAWLLRAMALGANAAAGIAIFWMTRGWLGSSRALWAEVFFFAVPAGFHALASAYLTNSFGHSIGVSAIAVAATWPFERRRWLGAGVLTLLLTIGFLSHTGSAVLLAGTVAILLLIRTWTRAGASDRLPVAAALVAAALLSVLVYYSHFTETYRAALAPRTRAATATAVPVMRVEAHQTEFVPGWPALRIRLAEVPRYTKRYLGWWIPALAVVGALTWRRLPTARASRVLAGWLATCALFFVVGHLTKYDFRYYLWVSPAIGIIAAMSAPAARPRHALSVLAGAAALVGLILGLEYWLSWLGPATLTP